MRANIRCPGPLQNAMTHFGCRQSAATVFTVVTLNDRATISAGAVASELSSVLVFVFPCVMPLLESVVVIAAYGIPVRCFNANDFDDLADVRR